jgi:hypothetical protein
MNPTTETAQGAPDTNKVVTNPVDCSVDELVRTRHLDDLAAYGMLAQSS